MYAAVLYTYRTVCMYGKEPKESQKVYLSPFGAGSDSKVLA